MFSPLLSFSLLIGGILHSPQRSSQFLPARALSLEGKSKGFSFISDRRRSTKHDSPERPTRKLRTPCPKYLILEAQKIAMRVFVCWDEDFPRSPDAVLSLNILLLCVRHTKIHFDFYWGKENTSEEQKIIVLICWACGAVQNGSAGNILSSETVNVYFIFVHVRVCISLSGEFWAQTAGVSLTTSPSAHWMAYKNGVFCYI